MLASRGPEHSSQEAWQQKQDRASREQRCVPSNLCVSSNLLLEALATAFRLDCTHVLKDAPKCHICL